MADHNHELFQKFPLAGQQTISTGDVPTPYHVYAGHGLLLGGTIALDGAQQLLEPENLYPLQTQNGRGLMGIWVCEFTDASLGPHNELQFSIFCSREPTAPVADHPLGLLHTLVTDSDVGLLCHGLWNNSDTAVAYNRELLGLPAKLNEAEFVRGNGRKTFTFRHPNGSTLIEGSITEEKRTSIRLVLSLMQFFGFRQSLEITSAPYLASTVINPISDAFPHNMEAKAFIAAGTPILQMWQASDALTLEAEPYRSLDFTPQFVEHFAPFRFVYLMPQQVER